MTSTKGLIFIEAGFISFDHENLITFKHGSLGSLLINWKTSTTFNYNKDVTELYSTVSLSLRMGLGYELCRLLCPHLPALVHPLGSMSWGCHGKFFLWEDEFWGHWWSKYVGTVTLAKEQGFTQVRPLWIEVKTYFLLLCYCSLMNLDYKVPTPTTSGVGDFSLVARVSLSLIMLDLPN